MAQPVRTCIGCRQKVDQSELLRLVRIGTAVRADPDRRGSGRGAYVHLDQRCLDLASRRGAAARAWRTSGISSDALIAAVTPLLPSGPPVSGPA